MPKTETEKRLTDKEKIRRLEHDIRVMKRDHKKTFAEIEKDRHKKNHGKALTFILVAGVILISAAYIYISTL